MDFEIYNVEVIVPLGYILSILDVVVNDGGEWSS